PAAPRERRRDESRPTAEIDGAPARGTSGLRLDRIVERRRVVATEPGVHRRLAAEIEGLVVAGEAELVHAHIVAARAPGARAALTACGGRCYWRDARVAAAACKGGLMTDRSKTRHAVAALAALAITLAACEPTRSPRTAQPA